MAGSITNVVGRQHAKTQPHKAGSSNYNFNDRLMRMMFIVVLCIVSVCELCLSNVNNLSSE